MADDPPNPNLSSVTQPGTTSVPPPPNLKARIKESYDAIAPVYNHWTLMHRAHRMNYTTRLIQFLQADRRRNGHHHQPTGDGDEGDNENDGNENNDPDAPPRSGLAGTPIPSLAGMHALEVGCGSGVPVLEILLAKDMDIIGVDLSATQLALARAHFPEQTAKCQAVWAEKDMMELRYPPDEFGVVVGLYSLIHLPREEQTVFLHRVVRWLKPGGMVLINFAKGEMEGDVIEKWLGLEKGWMYWSGWGEEKMMQVIRDLGLEVLLQETTGDATDPEFVWVIARKN